MRLNPLDRMNDPRGRMEWMADNVVLPPGGVSLELLQDQDEVVGQIDLLLRLAARIACLTDDRSRDPYGDESALFHRGWARARMWEQYARQHTGAVLVFEKYEFIEAMDEERQVRHGDVFSPSPVKYADRRLSIPVEGYFETIDRIYGAIDNLTSNGHSLGDLFFVKNLDWAAETEFRIVVVYGKRLLL